MSDKKRERQYLGLVAGLNATAPTPSPAREKSPPRKRRTERHEKPKTSEPPAEEKEEVVKLTAYLPKSLHKRVKMVLIDQESEYSFSELIVKLLRDWEKQQ